MERDAVAVAFPDYEFQPGDTISVDVDYDEGYRYSSWTYEDPSMKIRVSVTEFSGPGRYAEYQNDDARDFFLKLMAEGSKAKTR